MKNLILITTLLMSANSFAMIPNPAAQNCVKLGGTLEIVQNPNGQSTICVVEEWKLFREMLVRGLVKDHTYPDGGMPNPASVNCTDSGGEIRFIENSAGTAGFCVIEQWTLFRLIDVITNH